MGMPKLTVIAATCFAVTGAFFAGQYAAQGNDNSFVCVNNRVMANVRLVGSTVRADYFLRDEQLRRSWQHVAEYERSTASGRSYETVVEDSAKTCRDFTLPHYANRLS